jgi:hypothetical protein
MFCDTCSSIILDTFYKCPINIKHNKIEISMTSLCNTTHVFRQDIPIIEMTSTISTIPEEILYYDDAKFCSKKCVEIFAQQNETNYMFSKSIPIMMRNSTGFCDKTDDRSIILPSVKKGHFFV